jgi:hypothetical protein
MRNDPEKERQPPETDNSSEPQWPRDRNNEESSRQGQDVETDRQERPDKIR